MSCSGVGVVWLLDVELIHTVNVDINQVREQVAVSTCTDVSGIYTSQSIRRPRLTHEVPGVPHILVELG